MKVHGHNEHPHVHVAKATGIVAVVTLLSRVLGMVRDIVIARYFGAGFATDAFFVAFRVPNLLRRLVAEGALATTFVPVFNQALVESKEKAVHAVKAIATILLISTTVLSLLGIIFADYLTLLFAPGFGFGTDKAVLTVRLTRIVFPYIVIISLISLSSGVINSLGRFALPACAPVILNITMIAATVIFSPVITDQILVLPYAVIIGGVLALLSQIIMLSRLGFPLGTSSPIGSPAVKSFFRLFFPAVLSSSTYQMSVFVNTLLASTLVEGSVSWLYYADRLFQFPLGVFSVAIATAILPTLSRLGAHGVDTDFAHQIKQALRWITFITIPASCGLIMLSRPIMDFLFGNGEFGHEDVNASANALWAFSIGLWPISCQGILARAYIAKLNSKTPALISVFTVMVSILLALSLMGPVKAAQPNAITSLVVTLQSSISLMSLGHIGIALAGSIAAFVGLILLTLNTSKIRLNLDIEFHLKHLGKVLLATTPFVVVILSLQFAALESWQTLAIGIPVAIALFLLCSKMLGLEEFRECYATVTSHFTKS